mgnify:CR=1 FL=1
MHLRYGSRFIKTVCNSPPTIFQSQSSGFEMIEFAMRPFFHTQVITFKSNFKSSYVCLAPFSGWTIHEHFASLNFHYIDFPFHLNFLPLN